MSRKSLAESRQMGLTCVSVYPSTPALSRCSASVEHQEHTNCDISMEERRFLKKVVKLAG